MFSVHQVMNKQHVAYPHNGILFNHEKDEVIPQKTTHRFPYDPTISLPGIDPKEMKAGT